MIVEVNIVTCEKLNIDPNTYCLLSLATSELKEETVLKIGKELNVNVKELIDKHFLFINEKGVAKLHPSVKPYFFIDRDLAWEEFFNKYPYKVSSKSGERILRTQDPNSQSVAKAKQKYVALVEGRPWLHNKILKALEHQIRTTDTAYMQLLDTYINERTFEKYFVTNEELLKTMETPPKNPTGYGNKMV